MHKANNNIVIYNNKNGKQYVLTYVRDGLTYSGVNKTVATHAEEWGVQLQNNTIEELLTALASRGVVKAEELVRTNIGWYTKKVKFKAVA
jgi:hypothetical protein